MIVHKPYGVVSAGSLSLRVTLPDNCRGYLSDICNVTREISVAGRLAKLSVKCFDIKQFSVLSSVVSVLSSFLISQ